MTRVDQFESVFRAALKEGFSYESILFPSVLVVTDLGKEAAESLTGKIRHLTRSLGHEEIHKWRTVTGAEFNTSEELLNLVKQERPDLICTYRNLHSRAWRFPHGLGTHLDVLVQRTNVPVLVLPHPEAGYAFDHAFDGTQRVLAMTDHLSSDHRLINHAVSFTERNGTLFLVHIEDEATFERYLDAISKIPTIETDEARVKLRKQLLKEPRDFIHSCRKVLHEKGLSLKVEEIVVFGHHLSEYRKYIEERKINLLVLNTKDEDQLAMHGLAYPLAVELRQIPLMML